jgi:hypothetical protein
MDMRLPIVLLALALSPLTYADDWPAPQIREVFSRSRNYFVRVNPGKSWGDTVGFSGAARGPFATAEFYRREKDRSYRLTTTARLVNPVAPVDFFVTDRGFLVTLDNWHNMGYGKVAVFYSHDGQPVHLYELSDLFTRAEVNGFAHSVSSIWWRKAIGAYVREDQDTLYVTVNDSGAELVFEVATGAYQYCETRNGSHQCRSSNAHRTWSPYREPKIAQ